MTITITDEFREKVDKAARSVAGSNNQVDWEDVSQDMWVWMLENPRQYEDYIQLEDPFRELKKVAKQAVYKQNNANEYFTGNYTYTPGEVKGLLNEYLLDVTLESVSEHVDLVEGLLMLRTDAPSYFKSVIDKWVNNATPHRQTVDRAIDKLSILMNQVNKSARYSYEGPGSRQVLSNSQAIARKDNLWN